MPKERIDILNNDWFYSKYLDIILVIKYIFVSMVGVAKKRVNQTEMIQTRVLQVEYSINILNTGFKDFQHPERGKNKIRGFFP